MALLFASLIVNVADPDVADILTGLLVVAVLGDMLFGVFVPLKSA